MMADNHERATYRVRRRDGRRIYNGCIVRRDITHRRDVAPWACEHEHSRPAEAVECARLTLVFRAGALTRPVASPPRCC